MLQVLFDQVNWTGIVILQITISIYFHANFTVLFLQMENVIIKLSLVVKESYWWFVFGFFFFRKHAKQKF